MLFAKNKTNHLQEFHQSNHIGFNDVGWSINFIDVDRNNLTKILVIFYNMILLIFKYICFFFPSYYYYDHIYLNRFIVKDKKVTNIFPKKKKSVLTRTYLTSLSLLRLMYESIK